MARTKLTDEEKEAKRKLEWAQQEEANLVSNLNTKRRYDHVPEPTVTFEVGEGVLFGCHPNAEVQVVYDDGKFYRIKTWGEYQHYSTFKYEEKKFVVSWFDISKFRTKEENSAIEVLRENDEMRLSYGQFDVRSLLGMYYGSGIDLSPNYQRGEVWNMEDKVALIDSLYRNIDIGKFVIIRTENCKTFYYEMLDGKQRLTALAEFFENKFPYRGKYFQDLSWTDQNHFEGRPVAIATLDKNTTQKQRYKYFLMVNVTGRVVSKEHLAYVQSLYDACEK